MSDNEELELDASLGEALEVIEKETLEDTENALPDEIVGKLKKAKKGKKKVSEETKQESKHGAVDQLLTELSKDMTGLIAGRATQDTVKNFINFERSRFGIDALNSLLSPDGKPESGGAPHGRFVVLTGSEGCCKTTLAMDCIAHRLSTYEDEYALVIDAENSVDEKWCSHHGVPMDRVIVIPGTLPLEDMATQGVRILKAARERGIKISMCLVDSLGAMAPAVEAEGKKSGRATEEVDIRTDHVATSARKINQMLRVWAPQIIKSNTCTFLIAHMMTDIGGYGGQVMKGGLGLKYFSHVILQLSKKNDPSFDKEIKCRDGEIRKVRTGYFVVANLKKSKISPYEGQSVAVPFMIGMGFHTMLALLNTAIGYGVIKKAGAWFKYGDVTIGQGQTAAVQWLKENVEERIKIEDALNTIMHEEGKIG